MTHLKLKNMKKLNRLKIGIFAIAMVLLCNPQGWSQTEKRTGSEPVVVGTAKKTTTSGAELRSSGSGDLNYSLRQAKSRLAAGQADNSLTPQQISDLKAKIASLEGRNKINASKPAASSADPVRNIRASKQTTRAQFLALTEAQQRDLLVNIKDLNITDLVNASSVPKTHSEDVYYVTVDNFRNTDIMKQIYVLKNPSSYKIVSNGTVMPKQQMSRAQLNTYPAERQKAILESNQFEITN